MWTEATRPPRARPLCLFSRSLTILLAIAALVAVTGQAAKAQANPLNAIVNVRAEVPPNARTAGALGTEREGGGVVISADGLVLTIGYLILEAEQAEVVTQDGKTVPAEIVAYDYETGFGECLQHL